MGTRAYWMTSRWRYRVVTDHDGEVETGSWQQALTLADVKADVPGLELRPGQSIEVEKRIGHVGEYEYEPHSVIPGPAAEDPNPTVKVHITSRVGFFLEGTQAFADTRPGEDDRSRADRGESNEGAAELSLMRKFRAAPVTRKDRRVAVELTADEAESLYRYVDAMQCGAADNTWDADGRADLFAANSALAQLHRVGVRG